MPTLLGKLGADVLAVNPYVSTAGRVAFDEEEALERVAGLVRASGAHLGAVIDADGERLRLVDDQGRVLSQHRGAAGVRRAGLATTCSATRSPCRSTSPSSAREIAAVARRAGRADQAVDARR